MTALPEEKLEKLLERWESIQAELNQGASPAVYAKLTKEFADISPVVGAIRRLRATREEAADLEAMLRDPSADKDMVALAREELETLQPRIADQEQELKILLLPKDAADERSAILEVRAGTGGDEAALFAADLFRMYQRYADLNGWTCEIISMSENDLGGYREIIASITGRGVFSKLKYESGVHRVQRVPATENQGRIHTSAATVAVLPEAEDVDIDIRPEDIRIDTMRASGAGGQHVNKTDSAVRITHSRPASSSCRPKNRSTRTASSPCRSCARASTRSSAKRSTAPAAKRANPGRLRRPLATHPHLQLSARPRHRSPDQSHHAQHRACDGGHGPRRNHRCARHAAAGRTVVGLREQCLRQSPASKASRYRSYAARYEPGCRRRASAKPNARRAYWCNTQRRLMPEQLLLGDARLLTAGEAKSLAEALTRRLAHEPLSRIRGERDFYGRAFAITPAVLDPRPETETLIDLVLQWADETGGRDRPLDIIDIGTGSGAILITLLAELPRATGLGTDVSPDALQVASSNAVRNAVAGRARFELAHALDGIDGPFDILVSNPPYIPSADVLTLEAAVRDYDPALALDGGPDGLRIYRQIAARAGAVVPSGLIALEVGAGPGGRRLPHPDGKCGKPEGHPVDPGRSGRTRPYCGAADTTLTLRAKSIGIVRQAG